jgi:hypothetical protein
MNRALIGAGLRLGRTACAAALMSGPAAAAPQTVACTFYAEGHLSFDLPERPGALPKDIDFDYGAKATRFSFGAGRLQLVAVDEEDPSRLRIRMSARLNPKTGAYEGQIFTDLGGNQLMYDKGPVRCTLAPKT